jgi:hypothetical protein
MDWDGYDDDPEGWEYDLESDAEAQRRESLAENTELAREIAANYGILDWDEIIVDLDKVDPGELRGERFPTIEQAVVWLFKVGVLEFGGAVYHEDIDMYSVYIQSDTPKKKRSK